MKAILLLTAAVFASSAYGAAPHSHERAPHSIGAAFPSARQHDYMQTVLNRVVSNIHTLKDVETILNDVFMEYRQIRGEKTHRFGRAVGNIFAGVDRGNKIAAHVKVMVVLHSVIKIAQHYKWPLVAQGQGIVHHAADLRLNTLLLRVSQIINNRFFVIPDRSHTRTKTRPYNPQTGIFQEYAQTQWYNRERPEYIATIDKILKKIAPKQAIAHAEPQREESGLFGGFFGGKKQPVQPHQSAHQEMTHTYETYVQEVQGRHSNGVRGLRENAAELRANVQQLKK